MASKEKKRSWSTILEITEREYKNFRMLVLLSVFVLGLGFGLATFLPFIFTDLPRFAKVFFWLYVLVYLVESVTAALLLRNGWVLWFVIFISTAMGGMGIFGASIFFIALGIQSDQAIRFTLISWFMLFLLMWWWGSRVYCSKGEIKEAVLRSKRIDLDSGTYAPYHYPVDLFEAGWARSAMALSSIVGGVVIGLAVYLSHRINMRFASGNSFTGVISGYILPILSVIVISAIYHEWHWMHKWEKKTGRKIYVKEIIDYKRLQEK